MEKLWCHWTFSHAVWLFPIFQSPLNIQWICHQRLVFNEKTRVSILFTINLINTSPRLQENEAQTAEQHARESIRIARTTRELLKKFAAAYHLMLGSTDVWGRREDLIWFNIFLWFFVYIDNKYIYSYVYASYIELHIYYTVHLMRNNWFTHICYQHLHGTLPTRLLWYGAKTHMFSALKIARK